MLPFCSAAAPAARTLLLLAGKGTVVLSACSHAGIVNVMRDVEVGRLLQLFGTLLVLPQHVVQHVVPQEIELKLSANQAMNSHKGHHIA